MNLKYNLIIVGDIGVGKTSFINRIHPSNRITKYPIRGSITTTEIDFITSIGNIKFDIWDISRSHSNRELEFL